MAVVSFRNFSFTYLGREEKALNSINLEIDEGTVTGILGPGGAGKSTLIQAMIGLVPNDVPGFSEGEVLVDSKSTKGVDVAVLAEKVGVVLEKPGTQLLALTVFDDVAFGPSNLGLPRDEILRRVDFALAATRLKGLDRRNPEELSGGQQQSLAIADILAMKPNLLALDEPVSMLDPEGKDRVLSIIRSLVDETQSSIIIAESGSDLESIVKYLDRVVVLSKGGVVLDGSPNKVLTSSILDQVGVGRPQTAELFQRLGIETTAEALATVEGAREYLMKAGLTSVSNRGPAGDAVKSEVPIIRVENVHHVFGGEVHALKGVNMAINRGEIVGVIGQNGSGKTTLCLHLVGILKPTNPDAKVIVDGVEVGKVSAREVIKHINYVFQDPDNQLFQDTVLEELSYGPRMMGFPQREVQAMAKDTLSHFRLDEYREMYVTELPRDAKTLLAIASVEILKPRVILIDEPTNGMDRGKADWAIELFRGFNRMGQTIVVVSHNMNVVARLCDRLIVMKEGRVILEGPTRDVFAQSDVLKEAHIRPPTITQISQSLSSEGFPRDILTVEEFVKAVSRRTN